MSEPKLIVIKNLFAHSRNQCAFPNCITPMVNAQGVVLGEICHIKAKNQNGPRFDAQQTEAMRNSYENLILLCSSHHKVIDDQPHIYSVDMLNEMKTIHEAKAQLTENPEDDIFAQMLLNKYKINISNNTGTIIMNSPGAIKADNLTFKTEKKYIKLLPPENTIASDLKYRGYIKHLIDRYLKFAMSDKTRKYKFIPGSIYSSIKKEFGVKWDFVPIDNFDRLVEFLHAKINRTTLGSINKGKGQPSYSTFKEFCENKLRTNT
ncbi:MAG: HNH endonuclease signature motif containing protein [bacterium]